MNTKQKINQRGLIGILLLVTIAVAAVAVISKGVWGGDSRAIQQKITKDALRQAKAAVLAYVETGATADVSSLEYLKTIGGRLPCPDQDGNGQAMSAVEFPCGIIASPTLFGAGYHSLGLLPWSLLGGAPIKDAASECLWLAIDGRFKLNTATSPLNSDSNGSFTVIQPVKNALTQAWSESILAGNPAASTPSDPKRVVAVIIAPGSAFGLQKRAVNTGTNTAGAANAQQPCPLTNTYPVAGLGNMPTAQISASNYLESYTTTVSGGLSGNNALLTTTPNKDPLLSTNTALQTFVQADVNQEKLNDQLIWITADEFSKAATKRTARILATYIKTYVAANKKYPPAAAVAFGPCVTSPKPLLQGFVPYSCPGTTGAGDMTMASGTDRLYGDPDWWYGQTHYAVSETCVLGGTDTNPCNNVAKINIGTATPVPAMLLMRGRAQTTAQICAYAGTGGKPNITGCIEAAANVNAISLSLTAPIYSPSTMAGVTYAVPNPKSSNDFMVQFTKQ
jgi:hypothetical protein